MTERDLRFNEAVNSVVRDFEQWLSGIGQSWQDIALFGLQSVFTDKRSRKRDLKEQSRYFEYFIRDLSDEAERLLNQDDSIRFLQKQLGGHRFFAVPHLRDSDELFNFSIGEFKLGAINVEFAGCRNGVWLAWSQFS